MDWIRTIGLTAALFALPTGMLHSEPMAIRSNVVAPRFDGTISVLTYNVRGLPWPVATGRGASLEKIGDTLAQLRAQGRAPSIVVLQEAFTGQAQAIGRRGGYRYAVRGPDDDTRGAADGGTSEPSRRWWLGETEGKFVGSGLMILSDYPIQRVRRVAFPDTACAGFDCLANKGALLATVAVPGAPAPIDIVDTHLNSRHASHADDQDSLQAYRAQVDVLAQFIRSNHDPRHPLVVAGDFNVGAVAPRRQALLSAAAAWSGAGGVRDAYDALAARNGHFTADMAYSRQHARDWQFFSNGRDGALQLAAINVPFGGYWQGNMLSDHIGYTAAFRLQPAANGSPALAERQRKSAGPDRSELIAAGD